jgi:hypothetical protein
VSFWLLYTFDTFFSKANIIKDIQFENSKKIEEIKQLVFYTNCIKSFLYIMSGIFTIVERKNLMREIGSAPLSIVDESLTEDLYQNIIQQSKHPNDPKLIADYKRLTLSKPKISCRSYPSNTLDESAGSGVIGMNKFSESINGNNTSSKDRTSKQK